MEMGITLQKAVWTDCEELHRMQLAAFRQLLEVYQDTGTNPGAEPLKKVRQRMEQPETTYHFICLGTQKIGAVRVVRLSRARRRISPIFLLPEFWGKGLAQQALRAVERDYPQTAVWQLDTIQEEAKLCHLYEKMGYRRTGGETRLQPNMTVVSYEKKSSLKL